MDKSLDFIEIYTNLFSKALSSNEPSHYTIVLFSNTLIHQAIDTSHREENINLDILKNLAFTISKWIQAQNSKHIISLINFSDEIQDLIQGSELDLINIKNALRSPHPLSYNFLESKPHKGKANGADFLTKISEKLNGLQAKNKFLVVLTDQTMKFDEGQVDWLSEIVRV